MAHKWTVCLPWLLDAKTGEDESGQGATGVGGSLWDRDSEKRSSAPGAESEPYGIAATRDGMLWYSESGVKPNTLVRFDPKSEGFSSEPIPSGGGTVRNMVATADGRLFLACRGELGGGCGSVRD